MQVAEKPGNELDRLEALRQLKILDTESEQMFDDVTFLASAICQVPIALISLVDSDRQWFKSKQGLDATETSREVSFCSHAILDDKIFEIEDALKDPRFSDNPLVTGNPNVRFYAGFPLDSGTGHNVGTVCVIDRKPRVLDELQKKSLAALARQVSAMFKLRLTMDRLEFLHAEQKQSSLLLSEAQRVAKLGNWSFDPQTKVILWSDQMFELFPESRQDGPPSFDRHRSTIHVEDQNHWQEVVSKCLQDGKPYRMKFRSVFPDGTFKWLEALGEASLDTDGKVIGLKGTCQDVTELVLAEESLKTERLKTLHSAKLASLGEMSAGIAHEINNPLAIISGTAEMLLKYVSDPKKLTERINTILSASDRIAKIIKGLRKFSRTSDTVEIQRCALNTIVEESVTMAKIRAERCKVVLEVSLADHIEIKCNEVEICQALMSLINNSIDAVKDLPERWIKVILRSQDGFAVLQVRDSGKGIPVDIREKLFQPFFTTKPVGQGIGLGLSITKGILEEHGATIALLDGEPNTCFEIRFVA